MKSIYLLLLLILLGLSENGYAQSDFILQFGKAKCVFNQFITLDSTQVPVKTFSSLSINENDWGYYYQKKVSHQFLFGKIDTGIVTDKNFSSGIGLLKDTIIIYRDLRPLNESDFYHGKTGKIKLDRGLKADTITIIDPVSLREGTVTILDSVVVFPIDWGDYSYTEIRKLLESGFIIQNNNKTYKAKSVLLYYSSAKYAGLLTLDYKRKPKRSILNTIRAPGYICISELTFGAEIATSPIQLGGYLSINQPNARLQQNMKSAIYKKVNPIPFTTADSLFDVGYNKKIDSILALPTTPKIPDPVSTLNGRLAGGYAQKGTLRSCTGIVAVSDGPTINAQFKVTSFRIRVMKAEKEIVLTTNGPLFTKEMEVLIAQLESKDRMIIDEIIVTGRDKTVRTLHPMEFFIIP